MGEGVSLPPWGKKKGGNSFRFDKLYNLKLRIVLNESYGTFGLSALKPIN
jgi:hypothetical protein